MRILSKSLMLLTFFAVMSPLMASAYSLTTRINTNAGQIATNAYPVQNTLGTVTRIVTSGTNVNVVITPADGYVISKIQQNTTYLAVTPSGQTVNIPTTNTASQTINVWFDKQLTSVTALTDGGGAVSPSGSLNLQSGTPKQYTFTPPAGGSVFAIAGLAGVAYTTDHTPPYAGPVVLTITVPSSNITITGKMASVIANAGAPQTVMVNSGNVTLNGSATVNNGGTPSFSWTQLAGPTVSLSGANTPNPIFPSTTAGQYSFRLTVTAGGATSTATATATVTASAVAAARNQCADCHQGSGISNASTFTPWSSSTHKSNLVMCYTCHVGTNTGGHPGATVTAAACEGCHSSSLSTTTHPVDITASKCLMCHDSHNPAQGIAALAPSNHPAVTLYTFEEVGMQMAGGQKVPVQVDASGKGMPYSPKQTCGSTAGCHVKNGADYSYDKISDTAFHSHEGRAEMMDVNNGDLLPGLHIPWVQSTAMVGKW